jgi:Ankyrin repeats (many copies)
VNTRNAPDGQTPLHMAAKLGRVRIVEALFKVEGADDTILDCEGKSPHELAHSMRMKDTFECSLSLT